jgi:hypothetical protein
MIEKKTVVDQIEITRNGIVQIRIGLLLIDDGVEIDCKWHRTTIEPGGDVTKQFDLVNVHLSQMGKLAVGGDGIARIQAIAAVAHTPEVVAAFRSEREKSRQK